MNNIFDILLVFVIGFTFSMLILPKISLVSFRRRLFDQVNARKMHTENISRLGGIAFFPCIMVPVLLTIICHNLCMGYNLLTLELTTRLFAIFSALFILYLMGMMDDLIGMRYRSKFVFQILCGFLLVISGLYFDNLYGLFGVYEVPYYIGMPFTILIIVYILNAINLIDGIDGLASGLSIIAFLAFGYMFACLHWWMYAYIAFAAIGVLIAFFYYNVFGCVRRGRKIFMGDTGSLTIGMLLAVMAIRLSMFDPAKESLFPSTIVVAFSFLIVPMLDVVRVVIHRLRSGNSPFAPDKNHIHHKFIALGMSQKRAMFSIIGMALVFAVTNLMAISYLSTTLLFLIDVTVWTVMHFYITAKIKYRKGTSLRVDKVTS